MKREAVKDLKDLGAVREQLRRALGSADATLPVDVWVDSQDRPVTPMVMNKVTDGRVG